MPVVMERISGSFAQVAGYAPDGQVHFGQLVGGVGIFLPIDGNVFLVAVVRLDELHALHEHATRTAARVVYLAPIGLYHLRNEVDNCLGRIIFAFAFTFSYGKLAQEIFINAPYQVVLLVFLRIYRAYHIQQACQFGAVKPQSGIVIARQSSL